MRETLNRIISVTRQYHLGILTREETEGILIEILSHYDAMCLVETAQQENPRKGPLKK